MVAKRVVIWVLLSALLVVLSRLIPEIVHDSIPSIYYVTPSVRVHENIVRSSGTIHPVDSRQIVLESTVLPHEVFARVGDRVRHGDILATFQPMTPLDFAAGLPPITIDSSMISTILQAYGITALLGEAGLSSDELAQFIEQQNRADAPEVEVIGIDETQQILSPISGVITSVSMTPNIPSSIGSALFTVANLDNYKVIAQISESDIALVRIGDPAVIRGVAFPGSVYEGRVSKIYPTARRTLIGSSAETVVDIEIIITNPDSRLRPGFSATVEIMGGNAYEMITVPYEAIRQDDRNNEYVYTFNNGLLRRAHIRTGREFINDVQVLEGLTHDCIVIFNPDYVDGEGTMIHLIGRADIN